MLLDVIVDVVVGAEVFLRIRVAVVAYLDRDGANSLRLDDDDQLSWRDIVWLVIDGLSCVPAELPCYALKPVPEWLPVLVVPRCADIRSPRSRRAPGRSR